MRRGVLAITLGLLLGSCGNPTATVMDGVLEATLTQMDGYDSPCLTVRGDVPGGPAVTKIYCDDSDYRVLAVTDTVAGGLGFTAVMYDESVFVVALTDADDAVAGILTTESGDPWSVAIVATHLNGAVLVVTTDAKTQRLALKSGEATVWP
jgi:hypothetical protein